MSVQISNRIVFLVVLFLMVAFIRRIHFATVLIVKCGRLRLHYDFLADIYIL